MYNLATNLIYKITESLKNGTDAKEQFNQVRPIIDCVAFEPLTSWGQT